jgi:sRNA-binding protein
MTKIKLLEANSDIAMLAQRFPAAFVVYEQRRKPLKIGVRNDIVAALPHLDPRRLQRALQVYTSTSGYLSAMHAEAARVDLSGGCAGTVTVEDAAVAKARLVARIAKQKQRKAERSKAEKAQKAAAQIAPKPVAKAEPKPEPKPASMGDSLKALREAARAQREARDASLENRTAGPTG